MLNVKQAAELLNVSPALVYALCGRRLLRHERHGIGRGKILIPEDALTEYRSRQTVSVLNASPSVSRPTLKRLSLS